MRLRQEQEAEEVLKVTPIYSVSPLDALQDKIGSKVKINYAPGVILGFNGIAVDSKYFLLPSGNGEGLLGEYFSNQNLEGQPAFTRNDDKIDFDWGSKSPKEGFSRENFSVRWTGFLQVQKSGIYDLDFLSDDGARLYLDDFTYYQQLDAASPYR